MPNPKTGYGSRWNITKAVKETKAGKWNSAWIKAGIVHCPVGKDSVYSGET